MVEGSCYTVTTAPTFECRQYGTNENACVSKGSIIFIFIYLSLFFYNVKIIFFLVIKI